MEKRISITKADKKPRLDKTTEKLPMYGSTCCVKWPN